MPPQVASGGWGLLAATFPIGASPEKLAGNSRRLTGLSPNTIQFCTSPVTWKRTPLLCLFVTKKRVW